MDEALGRSLLLGFDVVGSLPADVGTVQVLAHHRVLGVEVAAELLSPDAAVAQGAPERIFSLVSQVGAVSHRNLVGLMLAGRLDDGRLCLLWEPPGKSSLARELMDCGPEPLGLPRSLEVLCQLCAGLDAAHLAGFYHRDLRPERVTFGPDKPEGVVVQLHGLGRLAVLERAGLCRQGDATLVSPAHASPEQLEGGVGNGASDVYALGVLAFRLCTGRLPFECASPELYRSAHLKSRPSPPRDRRPAYVEPLPDAVNEAILACLEKQPGDRPMPTELTRIFSEAAAEATRRTLEEQRVTGPLSPWKRLRTKAVETARYVQYVKLGDDALAQALTALGPHDQAQQQHDQAVVDAGVRWDGAHAAQREREHRLRYAALELSLELGRLSARGEGDQPGAQDLTQQLEALLQSTAAARAEAATAMRAATTELTRARQAAGDWARQEANRVTELIAAVRARRNSAGDPSLHERIDALDALVKETGGGSVRTLPGH